MRKGLIIVALVGLAACSTQASPTPEASPDERSASARAESRSAEASLEPAASGEPSSSTDVPLGDAQSCTNDEIGFSVDYPEDWWANDRIEPAAQGLTPIPACMYFAPEQVELMPNSGLPPGIAVWFDHETQFEITTEELSREELEIDGRRALLVETEATGDSGFEPEGTRTYRYIVDMGDGSEVLVAASTLYVSDSEYEEAKPVLDAMIETLDFDE